MGDFVKFWKRKFLVFLLDSCTLVRGYSLMKKSLPLTIFLLFFMLLCFFLKVQLWTGYSSTTSPSSPPFDPEVFFAHLQPLTGTLFVGPNPEILASYENFFVNTDSFLYLRNYQITHQIFKDQFQSLSKRWIPIHIILENKVYNAYQNFFKQLQDDFSGDQRVRIQSDDPMGTVYVHSKVMVNEDAFWIQTANLTKSSFEANREHFFFSSEEAVRSSLVQLFGNDWEGNPLSVDQFHPNVVVCPVNCRAVVEAMLRGAEQSIMIQTQYILDPEILQILRHQSEKLDLHLIVADTVENAEVVQYFGPAVARKLKSNYNHTKMILVDGKYLLLGSMNLSENSLDNNREIWIILLDPIFLQQFEEGFRLDWKR